ncbi:hypothetical protein AB0395_03585 [Streptosporangium sp. NPDC051023]|uniref:hypothetical protein n=1 Tax=Streptosporangium sp. NPDC051023 TaxID=3155410 RepID=UPI00344BC8B6
MTPTDPRATLIDGLRDLAAFLETNPDVPIPFSVTVHHFPDGTDDEIRAEIDGIAELLGTDVDPGDVGYDHYRTGLPFGPVQYSAVGILTHSRARHDADRSYAGCITPAPVAAPIAPPHAA